MPWEHELIGECFHSFFKFSQTFTAFGQARQKICLVLKQDKMALKRAEQVHHLQPYIIHANEMFLSLYHRAKTSVSIEPMDDDFYNNNITNTKTGVKRRAAGDLQSGISEVNVKLMISSGWSCNR